MMEFIAAGGVTLILVVLGLIFEIGRSGARGRAIEDRVRFEQKRLDLVLDRKDPDQLGTLRSSEPRKPARFVGSAGS